MNDHSQIRDLERKLQDALSKIDQLQSRLDNFSITAGYGIAVSGTGDSQSVSVLDPNLSFSLDCTTLTGTGTVNW